MAAPLIRRLAAALGSCLLAGVTLTACFADAKDNSLAQDCSTTKAALETARSELTAAQSKLLSSPKSARTELQKIAQNLRRAADAIENAELKDALIAAAGDLGKAFGSTGAPAGSIGGGLAKLDKALQSRCTDG